MVAKRKQTEETMRIRAKYPIISIETVADKRIIHTIDDIGTKTTKRKQTLPKNFDRKKNEEAIERNKALHRTFITNPHYEGTSYQKRELQKIEFEHARIEEKKKGKTIGKYGYRGKSSYGGDPHWTTAKFDSVCSKVGCGKKIKKGAQIFYYPRTKSVYCEEHGKIAEKDFRSKVEEEDYYGGRY